MVGNRTSRPDIDARSKSGRHFTVEHGTRIWDEYIHARKTANDWQDEIMRRRRKDARFLDFLDRICTDELPPCPSILEVGCGTGVNLFQAADRFHGKGVGIDVVPGASEIHSNFAEYFTASVNFLTADGEQLPFHTGKVDLIFSRGVLEHHKEPAATLTEQIRVLKPGGFLVFGVPQTYNPYTLVKNILIKSGRWKWGWETQYTLSELAKLGSSHGLTFVGSDADGYTARYDLGLGNARRLAEQNTSTEGITGHLACTLDRAFSDLEERYAEVLFQEVLVAFRKPVAR